MGANYTDRGEDVALLIEETTLPGVLVLTPKRFVDARGFFSESYNRDLLRDRGIDLTFIQDNHSLSREPGTVRGLHFQAPPRAQAKLVRCGRGRLWDVAVDIRLGSPCYGKWVGVELSAENGRQLLIPEGFAHGFVAREPDTEILYKCTETYAPETAGVIRFDDPVIGIDWGLDGLTPIQSDKDAAASGFAGFQSPFRFEG
ncbi:dTDP-4-dehydrorhamnose 3,5-epimerase [Tropicimonas aquimaris]|uniref:dTDP-4-dehydrorhamnose 3,5-epimerase n=1 Tax=Tropicimonas aquimaris TaxID=914152 RepID=A0ABW3IVL6_9RHOB